jgi:hypothetical protein
MEGFMKYAVEMDSGAMIYISSFIKISSAIQKLSGRIHRHRDRQTDRQHEDPVSQFLFLKIKILAEECYLEDNWGDPVS